MKLRLGHIFAATLLAGSTTACDNDGGTTTSDAGSVNANTPSSSDKDASVAGNDAASPVSQATSNDPATVAVSDAASAVSQATSNDPASNDPASLDAGSATSSEWGAQSSAPTPAGSSYGGYYSSEGAPPHTGPGQQTSAPYEVTTDGVYSGTGACENCSEGGPDLTILSATLSPTGFTSVEVDETSCEIQDGCYGGGGTRTVIPFELTVTNSGDSPMYIGAPWNNPYFYLSECTEQYRSSNFVKAEVLNQAGEIVAVRHLPTSCIADEQSSQYTCSVQGLDVGESSAQPSNTCSGLDVTGLAAGAYAVRFTINANHQFADSDRGNNTIEVTLDKPECDERFCGGVCCPESAACVDDVCRLPDLRANQDAVERSLIIAKQTFGTNACELEEMCITGPGKRRLLQFEGRIENVGSGAVNPGPEQNNPLFEHSACHDHYHFLDFTDYKLLSQDGSVAVQGHKQSFCLLSMERVEDYVSPVVGEVVHPEPGSTGCNYLEAGWADIYSVGTPCQWVDVTDVPAGDYVLQVAVNPGGKIAEGNVENNVVQVPVHIPADAPCQELEVCGDVVDQDCDGRPDAADSDCRDSEYCCGADDRCGLGSNWQCDCEGQPEWEHHDCANALPDGGTLGGECCSADNSCNWANDGVCDCNGEFEWDTEDCNRVDDYCCQISNQYGFDLCGLGYNGRCDCGEEAYWEYDCGGGFGGVDGGGGPIEVSCCTAENQCNYDHDGECDCSGEFAWDQADCSL